MQIVLLRHGIPKIDSNRRMNAAGFGLWVAEYNAAGIGPDPGPPSAAVAQAQRSACVVCSTLARSVESARALGVGRIDVCETMFRELDMPYSALPSPRLAPAAWSVIFRLIWAAGYSANAESFKEARGRARACAARLAHLASVHGSVLLVGHGSLNWLIARQLKKTGWSGPERSPRRYWEFGVYCRERP